MRLDPHAPANFGVGSWIERRARVAPAAVALVGAGGSLTYSQLADRVRRLANGLMGLGVGHGDRVAWIGPNHSAFLEAFFASALIGAALAPVNHRLEPDAIRSLAEEAEPTVLIQHDTTVAPVSSIRHRVAVGGGRDGALDYEALVAGASAEPIETAVAMDDVCLLPHTSGTTGRPKRIMLTHANVTWNVVNFLSCADFRSDDVTPAIAPFFRVGGVGVNVLPVLFMGGTVVVPEQGGADELLGLIERHRVTVGFGNPDSLQALTRSERWADADLSSVRFIVTGGAPVPERLIHAYLDRGVTLLQGYGLSEAGPLALLLDPESALGRIGSAGKPPLLVDVRIVGPDGADVASGATGELLVRGPNVMAGYRNQPDATAKALSPDGWLRTGDAARHDAEGYVWIVDRVVDRIDRVEGPVYPGDVERVLGDHPGVADVGVVEVPQAGGGPGVVVAVVVPATGAAPSEEDLLAFARERLAAHEAPSAVRFVERLPRSSVGKLVRADLRAIGGQVPPPERPSGN